MKKALLILAVLCLVGAVQADLVVNGVDPSAAWSGYMNVSETPANGGAYLWGSGWGVADLPATFDGAGVLTLAPNSIGDTNPYWYLPSGGPGSTGNKRMEANFYQSFDGLAGQNVAFNYTVLSNTLAQGYTAQAFIKTFNAGWGLLQFQTVDLVPGAGSVSLLTDAGTAVTQIGFVLTGTNVWITDVAPYGAVTIIPEPATMALLGLGGLFFARKRRA